MRGGSIPPAALPTPFGNCYSRVLERTGHANAPQGRLIIIAAVSADGTLAETDVEPEGLPAELAECAVGALRAQRFTPTRSDLSSVEIDVRFIYRTRPFRPEPAAKL
jgi:hypothetical protein